jgi:hypothetical protein
MLVESLIFIPIVLSGAQHNPDPEISIFRLPNVTAITIEFHQTIEELSGITISDGQLLLGGCMDEFCAWGTPEPIVTGAGNCTLYAGNLQSLVLICDNPPGYYESPDLPTSEFESWEDGSFLLTIKSNLFVQEAR